jgi:tRNA-uridine 2-sulfurtransferase
MEGQKPKAIALLSGGLDSLLAAKIVQAEGVEIIGLHLLSPFGCREDVQKTADSLGIRLIIREKGEPYLDMVKNPKYGIGRSVNPCIDCRIFMFDIAEKVRREEGADFIITGEVLGQRPMSQQRVSMDLIDRKSGMEDSILRPLSARLFPPTHPERVGWVNRERLHAISGRSRKEQFALIENYGVSNFSAPGGGCLLTELAFAPKLRDFYKNEHYENSTERLAQSELLRYGRHFRPNGDFKFIVSRDEKENALLEEKWRNANGTFFYPDSFLGPNAVALGKMTESARHLIGEVIVRYGKCKEKPGRIAYQSMLESGTYEVQAPISEERLGALRL